MILVIEIAAGVMAGLWIFGALARWSRPAPDPDDEIWRHGLGKPRARRKREQSQ